MEKKYQFLGTGSGVTEINMKTSKFLSEALKRTVRLEGVEKRKNQETDTKKIAKAVTVSLSAEVKQKFLKKL